MEFASSEKSKESQEDSNDAATDPLFTMQRKTSVKSVDFNTAITLCEYGKFHKRLLILCSLIFFFAGCQSNVNAYIIPAAECDLNLNTHQKGLLNVAFLIGGVSGPFIWGLVANACGRKKVLVYTLIIDNTLILISSLSQNFVTLLFFRGLAGFFLGAPSSIMYNYLGEFQTSNYRVKSICFIGCFWNSANLFLPAFAWIIIPQQIYIQIGDFIYNSWRFYLALIGVPNLFLTCVLTMYPETPKYLLFRGKKDEALEVLREIFTLNTGKPKYEYSVTALDDLDDDLAANIKSRANVGQHSTWALLIQLLNNSWNQVVTLTSPPLIKWAILCWSVYYMNIFGWYGLAVWMPELFHRFETFYKNHPNISSSSVCELVARNATSTVRKFDCVHYSIDKTVFINTLIINSVCVLGNISCIYLSNRVGRRTIPVTASLIAGISGFAIYFVQSSAQILAVASIFSASLTAANIVLNSVVVDIFPIHVSALTICMTSCFGKIGAITSNIAFGLLIDAGCEALIFLVSGIYVVCGLLCFLLPRKKVVGSSLCEFK